MVRSKRVKRKYQRKNSMKKIKKRISTKRSRRTFKKKSRRTLKSRIRYKRSTRKVKTIKGGTQLSPGTRGFTKVNDTKVADTKDVGVKNNFKEEIKPPDLRWLKDEDVDYCMECRAEFGIFTRKHHCRNCGGIFCGKCSGYGKLFLDGATHRVCEYCYEHVAAAAAVAAATEGHTSEDTTDAATTTAVPITINITIRDLFGNSHVYSVSNSITIEELKGMNKGIPVDKQRLLHDGKDTKDSMTLYSLGIVDGTILYLTLKLSEAEKAEAAVDVAAVDKSVEVSRTSVLVEEPISILILGRTIEEQLMSKMPDSNFTELLRNLNLQNKNVTIYLLDKKKSSTEWSLKGITCVQITDDFNKFFDGEGPLYDFILNDTKTIRYITGEFMEKSDDYEGSKILKKLKTGGECLLQEIMDRDYNQSNFSTSSARPSTIDIVTSKCFDKVEGEKIIGTYPLECNPLLNWSQKENGFNKFPLKYYYRWQKE